MPSRITFERRLRHLWSPFPGNGFFEARDTVANRRPQQLLGRLRDQARAQKPANSRLFIRLQEISANLGLPGGPGRIRTSNQTVMSGGTKIACVDFPEDLTCSNVLVASRCDRFWCETGAVIGPASESGRCNRLSVRRRSSRRTGAGQAADWNDRSGGPNPSIRIPALSAHGEGIAAPDHPKRPPSTKKTSLEYGIADPSTPPCHGMGGGHRCGYSIRLDNLVLWVSRDHSGTGR
jgi:hypothetical protein